MKYCSKCGMQIDDNVAFCPNCGAAVDGSVNSTQGASQSAPYKPSGLSVAAKVLMIISMVSVGLLIVPLFWMIPMTVSYSKKKKNGEPVSTGFKVCTLLFVNTLAGILMLCDSSDN